MRRPFKFLLFIPLIVVGIFAFGWVIMSLWNAVLVPVLHVSVVTFWQALGLFILAKILFGFGGGGPGRSYRKQRMMWSNMTPEQKERFKEEWKCRSRRWGARNAETTGLREDTGM